MNFSTAIRRVLREKYAEFTGRAQRSEFWWYMLFVVVVSQVIAFVDGNFLSDLAGIETTLVEGMTYRMGMLSIIFNLIILVPTLAVTARRLQDTGRSGWWQLLFLVPIIGFLVVLFWLIRKGTEGENKFGPAQV